MLGYIKLVTQEDAKYLNIDCWECKEKVNVLDFSKHFRGHLKNE